MEREEKGRVKNWIQGGQIVHHFFRMFKQIVFKVLFVAFVCCVIYIFAYFFINTAGYERNITMNYYLSYFITYAGFFNEAALNSIQTPNGTIALQHSQIANSSFFQTISEQTVSTFKRGFILSIYLFVIMLIVISIYITNRGSKQRKTKLSRGGELINIKTLLKTTKRKLLNPIINLGVVPVFIGSENRHIEIVGAPRTGKSQTLHHLLASIKKSGDRAVVYSTSTEFIAGFYEKAKDTILNPLDTRAKDWDVWQEILKESHYDAIAASIVPKTEGSSNDPFWVNAAQILLANTIKKLPKERRNTQELLRMLFQVELKEVARLVTGTSAHAIVAEESEKTAASIRTVLATFLNSLIYLKDKKDKSNYFSIRNWVADEKTTQGQFVFITAKSDQQDSLRSLVSCWVDTVASSILSLPEDRNRRIWVIIDEWASLHKLQSIQNLLAQGPKNGACVVLCYQGFSQVEAVYGLNDARSMLQNIATKVFYGANSQYNAERASEELGREEVRETQENISLGASDVRDGVGITSTTQVRNLVLATTLINLKQFCGYARLPIINKVIQFTQTIYKTTNITRGFIESTSPFHVFKLQQTESTKKTPRRGANKTWKPPGLFDDWLKTDNEPTDPPTKVKKIIETPAKEMVVGGKKGIDKKGIDKKVMDKKVIQI